MAEEQEKDPKIIIDEDWKSQVEAEKQKIEQEAAPADTAPQATEEAKPGDEAPPVESTTEAPELPPATFSFLVTTLATQALIALGVAPDPLSGEAVVQKEHAKHYIDTLAVLDEKTRGNLDPDEAALMEGALHQLRMLFVDVQ